MALYLFVCGGNGCLCKMGILRGRFHALSSAGKMEDWTGYIFSLLLRRIFFISIFFYGLTFRAIHRATVIPPLVSCRAWPASCMLSRTLSSSFYEMLDALFLWVDSVEKESLVAMARRRCFFLFD